jgi:hypothetical protein
VEICLRGRAPTSLGLMLGVDGELSLRTSALT